MLKINDEKKTVTVSNVTADEEAILVALVKAGYTPRAKRESKATTYTVAEIKEAINNMKVTDEEKKELLKTFDSKKKAIKKGGAGWFGAIAWAKEKKIIK